MKKIVFIDDKEDGDNYDEVDDDDANDPDWRNTPIYKRLQALKVGESYINVFLVN